MLFTWDTTNLCIVFPSWRVTGTFSLIWSLIAVVALTAGYEAIREVSRRYEERVAENAKNAPRKSHPAVVFVIMVLLEVLVLERVTPYLPVVSKPMSNVTHYSRQGTLWYRKRRRARLSRRRCMAFRCSIRSSSCKSHKCYGGANWLLTLEQASFHDIQRLGYVGCGCWSFRWISCFWRI